MPMTTCARCGGSERCRTMHRTARPPRVVLVERCAACLSTMRPEAGPAELEAIVDEIAARRGRSAVTRTIRWRPPRPARRPRRRLPPLRIVRDDGPPTLRTPAAAPELPPAPGRADLYDLLAASVDVLSGVVTSCEFELVLDRGASGHLLLDREIASQLVEPVTARMPLRDGCVAVGTLRIGERTVRIYERALDRAVRRPHAGR